MNYTLFTILIFLQLGCLILAKSEGGSGPSGYTAEDGPSKWEGQCQNTITAFSTAKQSPINIIDQSLFDLPSKSSLDASNAYPGAYNLVVENTGHTVQYSAYPGITKDETVRLPVTLKRDNTTYQLAQFHFHTPSEHWIDNTHSDAEVHFVFIDEKGNGAVVGVLLNVNWHPKTPHFGPLFINKLPKEEDGIVGTKAINLACFFDKLGCHLENTYQYDGSLTTPGCNEGIKWHVNKGIFPISVHDFLHLRSTIKFNARPVQSRSDGAGGFPTGAGGPPSDFPEGAGGSPSDFPEGAGGSPSDFPEGAGGFPSDFPEGAGGFPSDFPESTY